MGGAFLSAPITTKKTNKYQHGKIRVVTCEMQGINGILLQGGESIWRMHSSSIESAKRSSCLQFSMGMGEWRFRNFVQKTSPKS